MTDTALIGSSCALGVFWSSKRYFDYLIDETNLSLLRGKEFGQAVIICPSPGREHGHSGEYGSLSGSG